MKTVCTLGTPANEWDFFSSSTRNLTFNTGSINSIMSSQRLERFIGFWTLVFIRIVTGLSGEGRSVWKKDPNFSPVSETQMFLYDTFPKEFLWGVGTGSFQVEGSWRKDGKGSSIWDHFIYSEFRAANSTDASGDSYTLLDKDLSALDFLGVTFYQFSISWSRLFPTGVVAAPNEKGLRYYNTLIDSLLYRNIDPVVTLYHWDLPLTLQEKYGGWKNESLIDIFNDYATFCFQTFGDRVKYWITIHNPYLVAWHGYGTGIHAPGEKGKIATVYSVGHNLIKAHAKVWHNYKTHFQPYQKGMMSIVLGSHWIEPNKSEDALDIAKCQQSMDRVLGWFAKPIHGDGDYPEELKSEFSFLPHFTEDEKNYIKGTADFFAFSFGPNNFKPPNTLPKMGQHLSLNLREVLNWIKLEYNSPRILIAENGWFTDSHVKTDDTTAIYMMKNFINKVLQAIKYDNIDVFGYTAWSLLDGFEWQHAYNIRRGLFYVDFKSEKKERIPKSSALHYKQIIQENGFFPRESTPSLQAQFSCDFSWGITESVLKAESVASSPQFCDSSLYLWNVTGDGLLHKVKGVKLKTRPAQCTDFVSIKKQLDLLEKMKVTHYRFALDWSLILPNGDLSVVNRQVLRYYRCVISEVLKLNIQSMVTLYYPTHAYLGLPAPLLQTGGWLNQSTAYAFQDYAALCFQELGDLVKLWITINEPNRLSDVYNRSSNDTYRAAHNLLIAHAMAWRIYDEQYRSFQYGKVSLSLHSDWAEPANPYSESHSEAANRFLQFEIGWFANPIFKTGDYPATMREYISSKNRNGLSYSLLPSFTSKEKQLIKGAADFYALNHFTTRFVVHEPQNGSRYEFDRDIQFLQDITCLSSPSRLAVVPWGLRKVLRWIKNTYGNIDIYITANGIDDQSLDNDELRNYYLGKYVQEVLKAYYIDKVKIKGYYAFKMTEEKSKPRFGFFTSDSKGKPSIKFYNNLISNNGFPADLRFSACDPSRQEKQCSFCLFISQKKPLIFFTCCLFSTLILLLTVIFFHKRKRRKRFKAKTIW
ncbi:LOW QUALITY PROTEIN: beta-klotho [Pezoporus wallicus]|uniref:LOW QUALITY PROTEIN: beta-klotho n=1 Tax=Pezoporus wallicus TaxID=35540 RepID=UPI00254A097B|nr:LOW QUALITY PROTEIN: beta-klotho [Pezoporus wallicus]